MNKALFASLTLSCLSILVTSAINVSIASRYMHSNNEDRLWFFLIAPTSYFFQYFVAIFGIAALILALLSKSKPRLLMIAISLSLISIIVVFVQIWRLFVLF